MGIKYLKGEKYWFYENYNHTGKILNGELIYVSSTNIAKLKVGEDNYWNLNADYLFVSKENLMASKEKGMKKEKIDELGK
ncbi:MAG: hypothetical protein PHG29_11195 [Prolixibacteraceae bacterium]|nr:hypothetical protein [Prolixibacteraceae bacterium]